MYFPGMEWISNCPDYHIDNIENIKYQTTGICSVIFVYLFGLYTGCSFLLVPLLKSSKYRKVNLG